MVNPCSACEDDEMCVRSGELGQIECQEGIETCTHDIGTSIIWATECQLVKLKWECTDEFICSIFFADQVLYCSNRRCEYVLIEQCDLLFG